MWFLLLIPVSGAASIVFALVDPAFAASGTSGCGALGFGAFLFLGLP
jgi:hypothetical protein